MNLIDAAALIAAGFGAGVVNAVAGGGSLITFPTLLAVGLSPVPANVTNSVAVSPGYLASVYGNRRDMAELGRDRGRDFVLALAPTAVLGAATGCTLLLLTPARAFDLVVPFLVLGATLLVAFRDQLRAVIGHPHTSSARRRTGAVHAVVGLGAIYGGYFGAALGVMLVAALGLVLDESLARVNALKNAISAVIGISTVVAFTAFGPVNWAVVAVIAPASWAGGYAGAGVARRLSARTLRAAVVVIGTTVGIVLLIHGFG